MASKLFREALAEVKPETKIFVRKYLDLVERIDALLKERKMTQKDLADALGLQPSAVSRLLGSDGHNMTLRTIAKLEAFFGQDILVVYGSTSSHRVHIDFQEVINETLEVTPSVKKPQNSVLSL